jgi:translation initiation factor IF-1
MSGSKRKSQYRKSVTTNYLHTNISLENGDFLAKVVCSRGANLFEIELSNDEKNGLGLLPNKFRNCIWIKRNDFIIVTITSEQEGDLTTSLLLFYHTLYKPHESMIENVSSFSRDSCHLFASFYYFSLT